MPWYDFIWNDEPGGHVEHIAEHGLAPTDIEAVVCSPMGKMFSASSGRPMVTGHTPDGRHMSLCTEDIDECTIYPVTAYEVGQQG